MTDFVCEPLGKQHDREQFDCGEPTLNHYLAKIAGQDVKRKAAAVFVMTEPSQPARVDGFYTLSATAIELSALPAELTKKLPHYPEVPAILIGRLARDLAFPGVGSLLLADALTRCVRVAKERAAGSSLGCCRGSRRDAVVRRPRPGRCPSRRCRTGARSCA